MPQATIDIGNGTKYTLQLSDEQVAEIVEIIRGSDVEASTKKKRGSPQTKNKKTTIKSLVRALVDEGFLPTEDSGAQGRSIDEIRQALQRRGYKKKTTTLSGVLRDLVRDGVLRRKGVVRKYRYFKPQ